MQHPMKSPISTRCRNIILTFCIEKLRIILVLSIITMTLISKPCLFALYALLPFALTTQATYGDNHLEVAKDSDIVASAFPDIKGVNLIAPAFVNPQTVPVSFQNGTSGPTSLYELGWWRQSE